MFATHKYKTIIIMRSISVNEQGKVYSRVVSSKDNDMIIKVIAYHKNRGLNTFEYKFISNISNRDKLSFKQKNYLKTIYNKYAK